MARDAMARKPLPVLALGVAFFVLLATLSGAFIYSIVTNAAIRDESTYRAEFRDVSGLREGSEVLVAGVAAGQVESLALRENNVVEATFTLVTDVPITKSSTVAVRYKDLLGRRVLEVSPGGGSDERLDEGAVLPAAQTTPALDLDQLYNGFSPLFEGLDAQQINELSGSLIAVMQGQGGTVESLLGRAGSLTKTIADRDEVINALIDNLGGVLDTVEARRPQTEQLVVRLQRLMGGLSRDRVALGQAISGIGGSTAEITSFIARLRPHLEGDLREIRALSRVINADSRALDRLLSRSPGYHALVGRVGIYQSAFQFYLCGVQLRMALGDDAPITTAMTRSQEQRCQS